jgi:hypothetical protein
VVAALALTLEGSGLLPGSLVRSFNLLLWAHQNLAVADRTEKGGDEVDAELVPLQTHHPAIRGPSKQRRGAINSPNAHTGHTAPN